MVAPVEVDADLAQALLSTFERLAQAGLQCCSRLNGSKVLFQSSCGEGDLPASLNVKQSEGGPDALSSWSGSLGHRDSEREVSERGFVIMPK